MSKTPKPGQSIYTDQATETFLEESNRESYTEKAWDLERSSPLGTLKDMIRKYHSAQRRDGKVLVTAQVLRVEESKKSLYQVRNPEDTTSNVQLVRYRVISDRRHQWIPEPISDASYTQDQIISLHPLAKYELSQDETSSPLKAGDIVEILFKDNKTPYSSYFETASVIRRTGDLDNIDQGVINRCANIKLPPLPANANAENIINDPCLVVGTVENANLENIQQQAAANSKRLVFPRFVVSSGEVVTSEFGKVRFYKDNVGNIKRRNHAGTDYNLSINTKVLAAFDGQVVRSQANPGGYGNYIVIEHTKYYLSPNDSRPQKFYTLYAHLGTDTDGGRSRLVSKGDRVTRGQLIGLGGNSGRSIPANGGDGSHLHFEYILPNDNGSLTFGDQNFKYRRDPVTEFFRRGFFIYDTYANRKTNK